MIPLTFTRTPPPSGRRGCESRVLYRAGRLGRMQRKEQVRGGGLDDSSYLYTPPPSNNSHFSLFPASLFPRPRRSPCRKTAPQSTTTIQAALHCSLSGSMSYYMPRPMAMRPKATTL